MTNTYKVHIFREMKLLFMGVEAETPEAAAQAAMPLTINDTVYENCLEECEGETFSALVVDDDFSQSVTIEFEPERQRKAAPELLAALEASQRLLNCLPRTKQIDDWLAENGGFTVSKNNRDAIAKATGKAA